MKIKVLAIAATVIIGGGIASHTGHEPKCLLVKMGIMKKAKEVKVNAVAETPTMQEHQRPAP